MKSNLGSSARQVLKDEGQIPDLLLAEMSYEADDVQVNVARLDDSGALHFGSGFEQDSGLCSWRRDDANKRLKSKRRVQTESEQ